MHGRFGRKKRQTYEIIEFVPGRGDGDTCRAGKPVGAVLLMHFAAQLS